MSPSRQGWLRLQDRVGGWVIAAAGAGVVAAVIGIFAFVARETYPLFLDADIVAGPPVAAAAYGPIHAVATDPQRGIVAVADARGVRFFTGRGEIEEMALEAPGEVVSACLSPRTGATALGLRDGRVLRATIDYRASYEEGVRHDRPVLRDVEVVDVLDGEPVVDVVFSQAARREALVARGASGTLIVHVSSRSALGVRREVRRFDLGAQVGAAVSAMALDGAARSLALGTRPGGVEVWRLDGDAPRRLEGFEATTGTAVPVTSLAYLLGDLSLVVGDGEGRVSTWFQVAADGASGFRRIHRLRPQGAAITAIAPSQRDKQFLTGAADGHVALHHATSEQTFFQVEVGAGAVTALHFAPKADGLVVASRDGGVQTYGLHNPHPEVTAGTLFGRVWYEGYDRPEFVWQSTGGTDEFEPKLSLVPLIFGTVKGTLYAMLFAVPLAILAALYTAEFAPPRVRAVVKPTVELMASLPSVILGFLAGLWLAPLLERHIVGTGLLFLAIPAVAVAGAALWNRLPMSLRGRLPREAELAALTVVVVVGAALALTLGDAAEIAIFGQPLPRWLESSSQLRFDQRNSIVIGFAMGFAVIPLVFTICEDALSGVPAGLRAASLGLGATRWQTAIRVALPMALPGVFSATMIGFGRAVGETMIVLMATGNTPILDWSLFTGMRTVAANIAVELPEAPHQGTLYRVLFLSGLLLFIVTFAVNTVAEAVRLRLRERYERA